MLIFQVEEAIGRAARSACRLLPLIVLLLASLSFAQEDNTSWFELEKLNAGLGGVPEEVVLETPRDAVDSFLEQTRRADYPTAAHTLNLNDLDSAQQPQRGARLARMLAEVLERRVVIDWSDLPGRPDAMNVELPESHPLAGKVQRSIVLAELPTSTRPSAIRLNRVKPAGGEAVWVFSRQTVDDIPRLYAEFGPGWIEREFPAEWTAMVGGNVRSWELVALPALFLLSGALFYAVRNAIRFTSQRTSVVWLNRASNEIKTPLALAFTASLVQYTTGYLLTFSSLITAFLNPALVALMIVGITLAALNVIDATLEVVTDRYVDQIDSSRESERRHLYTNIYALRRFVLLAAVVISVVLIVYKLNVFGSFALSLLASAGVATVVLGIAGHAVLGNILASLQLAVAKPIRIGDSVQYEGRWAYVESIYYTYVVLRCWDERRLIVPVTHLISRPFENWTMVDAKSTRSFTMQFDLAADPQVLRETFEKIVREDERALLDEMLLVTVDEYAETMQVLRFYATAGNPTDAWLMHSDLSEKMGKWVRENKPEWWPRYRSHEIHRETESSDPHMTRDDRASRGT